MIVVSFRFVFRWFSVEAFFEQEVRIVFVLIRVRGFSSLRGWKGMLGFGFVRFSSGRVFMLTLFVFCIRVSYLVICQFRDVIVRGSYLFKVKGSFFFSLYFFSGKDRVVVRFGREVNFLFREKLGFGLCMVQFGGGISWRSMDKYLVSILNRVGWFGQVLNFSLFIW